jgi:dephospho-CoA kinase
MITFGLTGGIACGKSTVTKTLRRYDIPVIDADIVAREVVVPGSIGLEMIFCHFGWEYLNKDGSLNRAKLGSLVFRDEKAMSDLNHIMGQLIQDEVDKQIGAAHQVGHKVVGYDAALICEMGNADRYRPLIVVSCPQDTQIARLMKRNNLTHEEALARIKAQMPVEEKIKLADFVVDTSGSVDNSVKQTEEIISKLRSLCMNS